MIFNNGLDRGYSTVEEIVPPTDSSGRYVIEVTQAGETVWEYVNPVVHNGILAQGERSGLDHRGHNWNAVFKIHRYEVGYPGLTGKDLKPLGPIEQPVSMRGKTGFAEQAAEGAPEGREAGGQQRGGGDRRPPPPPRDDERRPPREQRN